MDFFIKCVILMAVLTLGPFVLYVGIAFLVFIFAVFTKWTEELTKGDH